MTILTKYDALGNISGYWDEEKGEWVPEPGTEEEEEEEETEEE